MPSPYQLRLLQLVADGLNYAEIACQIKKSTQVVKNTLAKARQTLGANTTAEAVAIGFRKQIIR